MKLDRSTWLRASGWTWLLAGPARARALARTARVPRRRPRRRSRRRRMRWPRWCRRLKARRPRGVPRSARPRARRHLVGRRRGRPCARRERFVAAYDAKHAIVRDGDTAKLTIGDRRLPVRVPAGEGRGPVALRHGGRQGRAARAPHRRERAVRDQGDAGDRRRAAGVRLRRPRRRRRARVRAEVRERHGQARRTVLADEGRRAAEPARANSSCARPAKANKAKQGEPDALPRLLFPAADGPGQGRRRRARSTTSCADARSAASPSSRIRRSTATPAS